MIRLSVFNICRCTFLSKRELLRAVTAVLKSCGINDAALSITFVTDKEIRPLNRLYRKHDRPTDVLSFAMQEGRRLKKDTTTLGDIVISVDRARAQAKIFNTSFKEEMRLYIIHGVLHLLGYDDEEARAEKKMRREEQRLLRTWGQGSKSKGQTWQKLK